MKVNAKGKILTGIWRKIIPVPPFIFNMEATKLKDTFAKKSARLSEDERGLHHFIVKTIMDTGKPVPLELIAQKRNMPLTQVKDIVDKLESFKMYFFRYEDEKINWAYPVTAAATPHQIFFSPNKQVSAA
jgi:uncharacterized protein YqjF (DUF2071 family)